MKDMKKKSKTPAKPKREKAGQPPAEIDLAKVRELARFMFTDEELAVALGVCSKTLQRRRHDDPKFVQAIEEGHANGKKSLRAAQFQSAITNGNITMQIWLGKQYLNQKDKGELSTTIDGHLDISNAKATLLRGTIPKPSRE
jgi:hypothetical protein